MENLKINTNGLLKAIPAAALAGALVNAILFYVGRSVGLMDDSVGAPGPDGAIQPIGVVPIIMSSIVPVVVAGILLALLNRFTANPMRIFGIICLVLFVVTLANPFVGIPNLPIGMGVWLDVMHAVVAASVWYGFNYFTKR